jgi:hypothetical protein
MDSNKLDTTNDHHRLRYIDRSMFPPAKRAAYLGEEDPEFDIPSIAPHPLPPPPHRDLTDSTAPAPPPSDEESWREVGNYIYTGEAFVYVPRNPKPEHMWDIPSQPEALTFPETLTFEEDTTFLDDIPFRLPGSPYPPLASRPSPPPTAAVAVAAAVVDTPVKPTPRKTFTPKRARRQTRIDSHSPVSVATPRAFVSSPPQEVTEWDDAALLRLWQWKIVKKKGFGLMLRYFPGQTEDSLREVWEESRDLCRQLGSEWERQGRPRK